MIISSNQKSQCTIYRLTTFQIVSERKSNHCNTDFSGDHSELAPPDPMPNSEVKRLSADGSVGLPHVRVGHRQNLIPKIPRQQWRGIFLTRFWLAVAKQQPTIILFSSSGLEF